MKKVMTLAGALAVAVTLVAVGCGSSGSDSSTTTTKAMATTTAAGSGGNTVNIVVGDTKGLNGPMTMTVDKTSVPAGSVTFTASNTGTIVHEVIVLKTDTPVDQLKVGSDHRVSEDDSVGEISEFAANTSSSVTLDLKPGNYVLVCNIANHYEMGMRAALKVT